MNERVFIRDNGGAFQKQTTKSEAFLPVLQILIAVLAVAVAVVAVIIFLWMLQPTAAMLIFWPCAVFFAWRRQAWQMAACIAAAGGVVAAVFTMVWPLYPAGDTWELVRIVTVPATLFFPVGCYHIVKRMVTDACHPNLANSVRARSGKLVDSPIRDRIVDDPQPPEGFEWQQ